MKLNSVPDKMGMCASAICMLHCLSIPILLLFGLDAVLIVVDQEWIELLIIILTFAIGVTSFLSGFITHKQHFIPVLFVAGFLLIVNGEAVSHLWVSLLLSVAGAIIIIYAHVQNLKWRYHASVR
ncbi:MAG: MerC domain-containing protein [Bacteroidota bacterium]